jgi:hypothetical protein
MLLYLDQAWDKFRLAGRMNGIDDLRAAVIEGAMQRIRPKIMAICAILFGLLPIMWSPTTQIGAAVMKRIAAPMIGGVVTSGILELLLYPVIYVFWRKRHLGTPLARTEAAASSVAAISPVEFAPPGVSAGLTPAPTSTTSETMRPPCPRRLWLVIVVVLVIAAAAGGFCVKQNLGSQAGQLPAVRSLPRK